MGGPLNFKIDCEQEKTCKTSSLSSSIKQSKGSKIKRKVVLVKGDSATN